MSSEVEHLQWRRRTLWLVRGVRIAGARWERLLCSGGREGQLHVMLLRIRRVLHLHVSHSDRLDPQFV
jgi:hypothetical protein